MRNELLRTAVRRWGPERAWLRVLLLGVVVVLLLLVLATEVLDDVLDGRGVTTLDRPVLDWLIAHRTPGLTTLLLGVSAVGGTVGSAGATLLAGAWAWWRGRRVDAVLAVGAAAGASLLIVVGKRVVARERPPLPDRLAVESSLSFPSGHALFSATAAVVVACLVLRGAHRRWLRVLVVVLSAGASLLIGVSRLYLGVHWTTDVLGGWVFGAAWGSLCLTAGALARLRWPDRAVPG